MAETRQIRTGGVPIATLTFSAQRGLTHEQLCDVKLLAQVCNEADGISLKLNYDMLAERPTSEINDFMCWDGGHLVGFLALYRHQSNEIEVSGMVHPHYRHRGIFTRLWTEAEKMARMCDVLGALFIVERNSEMGRTWAESVGAHYHVSEYRMNLENPAVNGERPADLQLQRAQLHDVSFLARVDSVCFGGLESDNAEFLGKTMKRESIHTYLIVQGGHPVGKIAVNVNNARAFLFGFGILPEYRAKGYGRAALTEAIYQYHRAGYDSFTLEVSCSNERALGLYQSCGFHVVSCNDYYAISLA